jgi:hypothetical protein
VFFLGWEPDEIESARLERLAIRFVLFEGAFQIRRAEIDCG